MQINYENKQSEPNKVNTGDKTVNPIEKCEKEKHNYQYLELNNILKIY